MINNLFGGLMLLGWFVLGLFAVGDEI